MSSLLSGSKVEATKGQQDFIGNQKVSKKLEGRDAAATVAASVLQEASIFFFFDNKQISFQQQIAVNILTLLMARDRSIAIIGH